jgi:hypothetical protein
VSIWNCPQHGLYGGDVLCPNCGGTGEYVMLTPAQGIEAAQADETVKHGSAVGESPVAASDAPEGSPDLMERDGE